MKAIAAPSYNLVDIAEPVPGAGRVVVRVQHAGVNPVDWKLAGGPLRLLLGLRAGLPWIPGLDFAGVVVSVGAGVVGFSPGDRVAGVTSPLKGQKGSFAEQVAVEARQLAKVPGAVPSDVAAVLPVAGTTAWQGLFEMGRLKSGGRVLILGAAGGVGHVAVQLAKAHGAHVTGVCSGKNVDQAKRLGCDVVVDYQVQSPLAVAERFDVVFDTIGSYAKSGCRKLLTADGQHVTIAGGPAAMFGGKKTKSFMARSDADLLQKVLADVAAGTVRPIIAARFPLAQAAQAIAESKGGRTVGKIVIDVA